MSIKRLFALVAMCFLWASSANAQRRSTVQSGARYGSNSWINDTLPGGRVPVDSNIAMVAFDSLRTGSKRVVVWMPALRTEEDWSRVSIDDQDGLFNKLACLGRQGTEKLLNGVEKSATAWSRALMNAPHCDLPVANFRQEFYVVAARPWYDDPSLYKATNLIGLSADTKYWRVGFAEAANSLNKAGIKNLERALQDTLRQQMLTKVSVSSTGAGADSAQVTADSVIYPFQDNVRKFSTLDRSNADDLINMIINRQCPVQILEPGTVEAKNTGISPEPGGAQGIVSLNRIYTPTAGQVFYIARCKLKSGMVVDILEHCSNIAFPLMGVRYSFEYNPKPLLVAKVPVTSTTPSIPEEKKGGGFCSGNWKYVCIGVPAAIGIFAFNHGGGTEGNKPVGQPGTRY